MRPFKVFFCLLVSVNILLAASGNIPGSGTSTDPYLIEDVHDFFALDGTYYGSQATYIKLMCDIDLSDTVFTGAARGPDYDTGGGFEGISMEACFDGNGHVIDNMTIDITSSEHRSYVGLFGMIDYEGIVKNLTLNNISITSEDYSDNTGGICGINYGMIINCKVEGTITGTDSSDQMGGICGRNEERGLIANCFSDVYVSGNSTIGGLCGGNLGSIINSNSTSSVTATGYGCGGFCGYNENTITNCYSKGQVFSTMSYSGGFCGRNNEGVILNCFWDKDTAGITTSFGGTGLTTAEMKDPSNFINASWDLTEENSNGTCEIWDMPSGSYPMLSSFNGYTHVALSGNGTENDPYIISTAQELGVMYHYDKGAYYQLKNDIDLTSITFTGSSIVPGIFYGQFDGQNNTISNFTLPSACNFAGLFSKLNIGGEIKNLNLQNINIDNLKQSVYLGGICGYNFIGDITECSVTGTISGDMYCYFTGGICGFTYGGIISQCGVEGTVSVGDYSRNIGGICGQTQGMIYECYTSGTVQTGSNCYRQGGLAGYSKDNTIENSYSFASITHIGGSQVAGLIGSQYYNCNLVNCYYAGDYFTYSSSKVITNGNGPVLNCFWDTETTGVSDPESGETDTDGKIGLPTTLMQNKSTFTNAGWNFPKIWHMPYQATGYPMLWWQRDIPGDIEGSYGVNLIDYETFSNAWNSSIRDDNFDELLDLHDDDIIDLKDIDIFTSNWLEGR